MVGSELKPSISRSWLKAAVKALRLVQKELHRQKNKEHEIASYTNRLMLKFLHFQVTVVMFTYRREQPLQQFLQVHNFLLSAFLRWYQCIQVSFLSDVEVEIGTFSDESSTFLSSDVMCSLSFLRWCSDNFFPKYQTSGWNFFSTFVFDWSCDVFFYNFRRLIHKRVRECRLSPVFSTESFTSSSISFWK